MSGLIDDLDAVGKKDDPNYEQLRGHVPKALAKQFKQFCLDQEIDYSEGMERVLTAFFASGLDQLEPVEDRKPPEA